MQNSSLSECGLYSSGSIIAQIVAHVVTCLFALSGNFLIIANFAVKKYQDRTLLDGLIVNMAVSDLLVPILLISREIHKAITGSKAWIIEGLIGEILCRLVNYMGDIISLVSTLSLCFITIERFLMVVVFGRRHPFQFLRQTRNKRTTQILIAASWIIPMVYDFHFFFTFRLLRKSNQTYCTGPTFSINNSYYIYNAISCIVFIIIPFVILLTLNSALVITMRQMFRSLSTASGDSNDGYRRRRLQKENHIKNLMIAIVVAFGLCWGPFNVIILIYTFYWKRNVPNDCWIYTFKFIAVFLARANAAINPWIYIAFKKGRRVRFTSFIQWFPFKARVAKQSDMG